MQIIKPEYLKYITAGENTPAPEKENGHPYQKGFWDAFAYTSGFSAGIVWGPVMFPIMILVSVATTVTDGIYNMASGTYHFIFGK